MEIETATSDRAEDVPDTRARPPGDVEPYSPEDLESHLASEAGRAGRIRRNAVPAELLERPRVGRLIGLALEDWAIIGVCQAGILLLPWFAWPPLIFVIAARMQALGVILHDACHMPRRSQSWLVYVLEALTMPVLSTVDSFRYHHLRHHRDSGLPTDPYFKTTVHESRAAWIGIILRQLTMPIGWTARPFLGLVALAVPALRNVYGRVLFQDKSGADLRHDPELLRCARAELRQVLWMSPVFVGTVLFPVEAALLFWIPQCVFWMLSGYRVLSEHIYLPARDRSVETLLSITVDHHLTGLQRFFFAPRNIGYHIVHHLHPQVALYALPALRRWYLESYPEQYPREVGGRRQALAGRHA